MIMTTHKCPKDDCDGLVRFKRRVITCFRSEDLIVTDIECDTCDFVMRNVFKLRCWTSDDDLTELIDKDAQENELGISISEAIKKYNISNKTAIRIFERLGAMDDE